MKRNSPPLKQAVGKKIVAAKVVVKAAPKEIAIAASPNKKA